MAVDRAVLKRNVERKMAPPDLDARCIARYQRAGDADVNLVAEQMLRVEHPKRQSDHGRHRRESDVALGEIEFEADDFATLPLAAADHAGIGNRRGIRADPWAGQRKTRNLLAARQSWQVMAFLLFGPVVQQQFRGTQRVRDRDRGRAGHAAAREFDQHAGMRVG